MPHPKEHTPKQEWYKHTGNCAKGRKSVNGDLRRKAKKFCQNAAKQLDEDKEK